MIRFCKSLLSRWLNTNDLPMYLDNNEIEKLLDDNNLIIRPLLDRNSQLGQLTIDFRLGTDFLVSFQGRDAYIDASGDEDTNVRPIDGMFDPTRRRFGETFLFHPNQTVLCSSLEYVKLPTDVYAVLNIRSSYARLGLSLSTIVQPGYCGCLSLELTNNNNNPLKVTVGSRIVQARLYKLPNNLKYSYGTRKYVCQVRPVSSKANLDPELLRLRSIEKT